MDEAAAIRDSRGLALALSTDLWRAQKLIERDAVIDCVLGNEQRGDDREDRKHRRLPEHRGKSEFPTKQTRKCCADNVSGVIEGFIASVLPVEAGLAKDAERETGHSRAERRSRDRRPFALGPSRGA